MCNVYKELYSLIYLFSDTKMCTNQYLLENFGKSENAENQFFFQEKKK